MKKTNLITNYKKGLKAEIIATWYLRLKGYKILARRYKTPYGEVDIIAKYGKIISIIEVKARPNIDLAKQAITYKSTKRIRAAAKHWFYRQGNLEEYKLRFDVIFICSKRLPIHLTNYF